MKEKDEQLKLDTRPALKKAIATAAGNVVSDVSNMIGRYYENQAANGAAFHVKNRHEAYGIAAEHLMKINRAVKKIKDDTATLLGTLPDPNLPAVEAISDIYNSSLSAAAILIQSAAQMWRTRDDLYAAEIMPEKCATEDNESFQEVEPLNSNAGNAEGFNKEAEE